MNGSNTDNYYRTYGWMLSLGLTRAQLAVFAVIHSFTESSGAFSGTREYLAERTGYTRRTAVTAVRRLEELGLVAVVGTRMQQIVSLRADPASVKSATDTVKSATDTVKSTTENVHRFHPIINIDNTMDKPSDKTTPSGSAADPAFASAGSGGAGSAPVSSKRSSKGPDPAALEAEFAEIWARFPRHEGKADARREYFAARRRGESREVIERGVEAYRERVKTQKLPPRYIAAGGNWFKGRRWDAEEADFAEKLGVPESRAAPGRPAVNPALRYRQRRYTKEDLRRIGVDLGDDDDDD